MSSSSIDFSTAASVVNSPAAAKHQKLVKSAQDFEGMLMGSLWQSMGEDMKESLGDDSAGESFLDMGLQAVGNAMAKTGGIGIGRMILKSLEKDPSQDVSQVHGPK